MVISRLLHILGLHFWEETGSSSGGEVEYIDRQCIICFQVERMLLKVKEQENGKNTQRINK